MDFLTITGQVAAQLRQDLHAGRWSGTVPGISRLSEELGVSRKTVQAALCQLEQEGLLEGQGRGRNRRIVLPPDHAPEAAMRIAMLDYDPPSSVEPYRLELDRRLKEVGYQAVEVPDTLLDLGMEVSRVRALVERIGADAWIVCAASRPVLEWFVDSGVPAFALFGRRRSLPIAGAGPDHEKAGREMIRRLIELGHRRIVILVRESERVGGVSQVERAKFEEMESHGIQTSRYNLPEWEDSANGFHQMLDELFRLTPPTALIIDEPFLFHAAKEHLAQRGILAPADISLICSDPDPTFAWCRPSVTHVRWDHRLVVRRVIRWACNIAKGKDDRRQTLTKAEFIEGGTVGPVPEQASRDKR